MFGQEVASVEGVDGKFECVDFFCFWAIVVLEEDGIDIAQITEASA